MSLESKPNQGEVFKRPTEVSFLDTVRGANRAVYTLFVTPDREVLHREVADLTIHEYQPLQPPIAQIVADLRGEVMQYVDPQKKRGIKNKELAQLGIVLIQFTDYVPKVQPYAQTPYKHIESLYDAIVNRARETAKPLTFPEQLYISLSQTHGDLTESLWRLFIISRLHARWLDANTISDLPVFCREEKIDRMIQWQRSLVACKINQPDRPQDVGGDTYYAWTHALAALVYNALPTRPTIKTRVAAKIFQNGTKIMHNLVHKRNPQAVVNDHSNAANYGNAIGKVCAETLSKKPLHSTVYWIYGKPRN